MPFGVDISMDDVKEKIQEFLETFTLTYMKSYGIEVVKKLIDDGKQEMEVKDGHQLDEKAAPPPPSKTGNMKRMSSIRKKMKQHYFWIKDNFDLAYAAAADGKEQGTVNLWGYKVQGITQKPEGNRKGGPDWIPDEERPNCVKCDKKFSMVVWHHHCRNCGEVFCSDCASNKSNLNKFGYDKPQRVCDPCYIALGGARQRAETFAVEHQEAKEDDTFHGIRLLHKTRVAYVFECETLADKKEWMSVMQECAAKASPPTNPDPLLGSAFRSAHEAISQQNGDFGMYTITGTEGEMLGDLVNSTVCSAIIDPVFDALPDDFNPKMKKYATSAIDKSVGRVIRTLVGPAWDALVRKAAEKTGALEDKIRPLIEPVGKAKAEIVARASEGINRILAPVLEQLGKRILNSALEEVLSPFVEAHGTLYSTLNAQISAFAANVSDQKTLEGQVANAIASTRGSNGCLAAVHNSLEGLSAALKEKQKQVDALKALPVSATIKNQLDIIHRLARNTLHTVQVECKEPTQAGVMAAWASVSARLLNDSKLDLIQSVKDLLLEAVMAPLQEKVLGSDEYNAVVGPLDELIPEAVAEFISIGGTVEEVIEEVATGSIDNLLDASSDRTTSSLDNEMAALNIA